MDDLISRRATYDTLTAYYHHSTETQHEALRDALNRVPSAQPIIVPCDYVKACNEATMNKVISAVVYYDALEELRKHGYVLVNMREKQDEQIDRR